MLNSPFMPIPIPVFVDWSDSASQLGHFPPVGVRKICKSGKVEAILVAYPAMQSLHSYVWRACLETKARIPVFGPRRSNGFPESFCKLLVGIKRLLKWTVQCSCACILNSFPLINSSCRLPPKIVNCTQD